ncbi:hypothetical protein CISIN_1g034701mg [Citrus sinensis]|uniref:Uncharacterized protein n=1 Tax=Citrus sinensis TaxID=2711 RepID=A0A067DQY0_CITSI|nr:hypothetical protein CISIN_1g034701mg [Citrus sinensis]
MVLHKSDYIPLTKWPGTPLPLLSLTTLLLHALSTTPRLLLSLATTPDLLVGHWSSVVAARGARWCCSSLSIDHVLTCCKFAIPQPL